MNLHASQIRVSDKVNDITEYVNGDNRISQTNDIRDYKFAVWDE